jgi:hypothetical protein
LPVVASSGELQHWIIDGWIAGRTGTDVRMGPWGTLEPEVTPEP